MIDYFVIADVRIDDPERYSDYMLKAKPIVEKNGGEYLVRGGEFSVLEGDYYQPRRMVIIRFPSKQDFENFYLSEDYQAVRKIRLPAGDMVLIGIEGFEA